MVPAGSGDVHHESDSANNDLRPVRRRYPYKFPYFLFPKKIPYALASHRPDTAEWVVTRTDLEDENYRTPYNYYSYYNFTYLFPHSTSTDFEHENRFDSGHHHHQQHHLQHQQHHHQQSQPRQHNHSSSSQHHRQQQHHDHKSSGTSNTMHNQQQPQLHPHHNRQHNPSHAENDVSPWSGRNMGKTDDPNHWDQPQPPPPPPSGFGRSNQGEEKPRGQGGGGGGGVTGSGTIGHAGVAEKQLVTIARSNHTHYVEHIKAIGERTSN